MVAGLKVLVQRSEATQCSIDKPGCHAAGWQAGLSTEHWFNSNFSTQTVQCLFTLANIGSSTLVAYITSVPVEWSKILQSNNSTKYKVAWMRFKKGFKF